MNAHEGNGFHGGLNESDSLELLALEDLLPIEALTAFHLLARREAFKLQSAMLLNDLVESGFHFNEPACWLGRIVLWLRQHQPITYFRL